MKGFDKKYKDFPDFILKITQQIWEEKEIRLPPNFAAKDQQERELFIRSRKRYYAMVENLDQNVGRMVEFLRCQALAENTIILFVSDHGELNGSHGLHAKQWPYEESIGIPLIVCDPSYSERHGTTVEDPTCTEDLFPTLLGLAGLKPKNPLPGLDLSGLIRGQIQEVEL